MVWRFGIINIVLTVLPLSCIAQRLDGCWEPGTRITREGRDRGLQNMGYSFTKDSLIRALADQKPDVRGAAAQRLAEEFGEAVLEPLLRTWLNESDSCAQSVIRGALSVVIGAAAWDAAQHPGEQPRVTPFQACIPSQHPILALTIEQTTDPNYAGAAVRLTYRNLTQQTIPLAESGSPADLLSAVVLAPSGQRATVAKGMEWLYEPLRPNDFSTLESRPRILFQPLPPSGTISWMWRIGGDFDLSSRGLYQVSLGGRISYLDTTVCSNTLWLNVAK